MTADNRVRVRFETVGQPFGTIKARMGATHLLMKRLPNVATEMSLHVLACNLTRVISILGTGPLMAAMRAGLGPPARPMDAARLWRHLPSLVTAPQSSWWLKLKIAGSGAELSIRRRPPTSPPESFHTTKTRCEHRLQSSAGLDSFADWGARIA